MPKNLDYATSWWDDAVRTAQAWSLDSGVRHRVYSYGGCWHVSPVSAPLRVVR